MDIKLSSNISKYRKEKGMTQEMLANVLGVTFASVSKWERDVATPDISLILQMASLFGVSLDTFIGYDISLNSIESTEGKNYRRYLTLTFWLQQPSSLRSLTM